MSKNTRKNFFGPRINEIRDPNEGQGLEHNLSGSRNWEQALDAIHLTLLDKWYYVAIISNTNGGITTPIRKRLNSRRKKKQIPEELKEIFKVRSGTVKKLNKMILEKQYEMGNKDIWYFSGKWKTFPKGTSVIELLQRPRFNRMIFGNPKFRRAFVILDGACKVEHQNQAMFAVNKVMKDKKFVKEVLEAKRKKERTRLDVKPKPHRTPADMVIKLKKARHLMETITVEEKAVLDQYFRYLDDRGEFNKSHKAMKEDLDNHFLLRRRRPTPTEKEKDGST